MIMADGVGFEPTDTCGIAGFQDQFHKPLGHPTIIEKMLAAVVPLRCPSSAPWRPSLWTTDGVLLRPYRSRFRHTV